MKSIYPKAKKLINFRSYIFKDANKRKLIFLFNFNFCYRKIFDENE